jgi:ElaB/YqjD/DUF883 family membrane-anchored ribosome-binding protein
MDTNSTAATAGDEITREKLIDDLRVVVRDAEALLKATAGDLSERTKDARARLGEAMERAKESLAGWEDKAREGARAADQIVREHPYQSLGVAFGVGLLIGVLVNRK